MAFILVLNITQKEVMMQSSVDWLVSKLPQRMLNYLKEEIEQAKEMHKEQIMKAWMATDNELQRIAAEQYYNETYGGNNE
jgi:hypothetical protein